MTQRLRKKDEKKLNNLIERERPTLRGKPSSSANELLGRKNIKKKWSRSNELTTSNELCNTL